MRLSSLWPAALVVALCALPAWSQPAKIADLVAGKGPALAVPLKEVNAAWRQFALGDAHLQALGEIGTGFFGALSHMPITMPEECYLTRGELFTAEGETYIVAYKLPAPPLDTEILKRGLEDGIVGPINLTMETPLPLSLLNVRHIGNLREIRPADTEKLLAEDRERKQIYDLRHGRERSVQNLEKLASALNEYAEAHGGVYPKAEEVFEVLDIDRESLIQPGTERRYVYNAELAGRKRDDLDGNSVAFSEEVPRPNGSHYVVYLYGCARDVPAWEWATTNLTGPMPALVRPVSTSEETRPAKPAAKKRTKSRAKSHTTKPATRKRR